jgi:hypothetical protein
MKAGYEIVGFEMVPVSKLEPHPQAAEIRMDNEDRSNLERSIRESAAVYQPLLVTNAVNGDGMRLILDGVNRWNVLRADNPNALAPCSLVRGGDSGEIVLAALAFGRKRSTGQRIAAFLQLHKREVRLAYEYAKNVTSRLSGVHVTGRENIGEFADFTAEAIAERLSCSDKDVRAGIELLRCIEDRLVVWERSANVQPDFTPEYEAGLKDIHSRIMQGATPIRTWKAAFQGKRKTEHGRGETNWGDSCVEGLRRTRNAFEHWKKISMEDRKAIIKAWRELQAAVPEDLK